MQTPSPVPPRDFSGHLALIAEMMREFALSQDMTTTAQQGLIRITQALHAEAASMFMLENGGTELVCTACHGPVDVKGLKLPATHGIVGRSVQRNCAQLVSDVDQDPDFYSFVDAKTGFCTRSILCAPISMGEERLGAIQVINRDNGELFGEEDRKLLEALGSSVALAILNARLAEAMVEREKMHRELQLAAEIQRSLLPAFKSASFPIFALNHAARMVSGDFYDAVKRHDGRICFNVGDVSGKGMNAALLMAKTSSLFRCLIKTIDCPGRLLAAINAELCETGSHGMFVTLVCGLLDPATGQIRLANAGHEPPLLLDRHGKVFRDLPASAPPAGIALDIVGEEGYAVDQVMLNGGSLYIFTDGLTEAYTGKDRQEMLGVDGVKRLILENRALPLRQRLEAVAGSVTSAGTSLRDDLTLLGIDGAILERTA